MPVPGGNLLKRAMRTIKKQEFVWREFKDRETNGIAIDVPQYGQKITLHGSIQAVPRRLYQQHGLDWKKSYITIYSSDKIEGVTRDTSGDQIEFDCNTYQVIEENDWTPIDGWNGVICAKVS